MKAKNIPGCFKSMGCVLLMFGFLTNVVNAISLDGVIIADDFESYTVANDAPLRLQTVSFSSWTSSPTSLVVNDSTIAHGGVKYVQMSGTIANTAQAKRTFTSIPTSGSYYINFLVYNNFSSSTLNNGTTDITSDDGSLQIRLTDGSVNVMGIAFRGRTSNVEFYALDVGGTTTFYDTGISYSTASWKEFTVEVNLSSSRVNVYYNGSAILSNIGITGYTTNITTIDIRTTFLSDTDSLLLDDVGFYSTMIPEPGVVALVFLGLFVCCVQLWRRNICID